jgi:hypothetical protein
MSRQQTTRSCNMASTFPDTRDPRANAAKAWVGHAEQKHHHHAPARRPFRPRRLLCDGLRHFSIQLAFHLGRAPAAWQWCKRHRRNRISWISSTIATSDHQEIDTRPPCGLEASRPSNRPRIGSGCSAYMTLDSTYLRCPPVSCNFRAPSATQLALHHRGLDQQLLLCTARATRGESTRITGPNASSLPGLASIMPEVDQVIK